MDDMLKGAQEAAKLILRHPGLPVYKMCSEYDDSDAYVLQLTGASVGECYLYGDQVFDDIEGLFEYLMDTELYSRETLEDMLEAGDLSYSHAECIWLSMEYAKFDD